MMSEDVDKLEILKSRAKKYSVITSLKQEEAECEVIQFLLGKEVYALETSYVKEVYPVKNITKIPCTPEFILGVINKRGEIFSVTDIKFFLNIPVTSFSDLSKIIILSSKNMEFGIVADEVIGISKISMRSIESIDMGTSNSSDNFIKGVTPERIILIDGEKLLSDERLIVNDTF